MPVSVILAKDLISKHFKSEAENISFEDYKNGDKLIPWQVDIEFKGSDLIGLRYEQLMPYVINDDLAKNGFRVITGDFITTEDGTGIVHIAPTFGADDFRAARESGIPAVMVTDSYGKQQPLVNRQAKFVEEITDFAGHYVKEEFYSDEERASADFKPTDVLIAIKLKEDNKAFDVKKYEHSYPHCWRTDKPVLYYPLDSWFIKTTAVKERLVELNKTINWKPEATGTGRFGNWLENLVDWNLSRSRYWGTPLPIWRTEDNSEEICIGSIEELSSKLQEAINSGLLNNEELDKARAQMHQLSEGNFDLHRPYVDDLILISPTRKKMLRETDLIDVWFDSGAMPYAQWGLANSNATLPEDAFNEGFKGAFPADFIAEGVDQTRGWFFTLHAISVMLNDSVAFKNVVSNGLVLDKNGNKMSKRLGNGVDPFETIEKYGADATRWYMISNASPWDNLKFNLDGLDEVRRKFFGTLYNTYAFFALYANIDNFTFSEETVEPQNRPEIDRWVISLLNTLTKEVDGYYNDFEPTRAARAIQEFVDEHLSNWYVRLCRRRFWKGDYTVDKISAYQTLYKCLITVAKLMSPIAPFFSEQLFLDLNSKTKKEEFESVHLSNFPTYNSDLVDQDLEERMFIAQNISSMILSLRKKVGINVRQPLSKILLPVLDSSFQDKVELVKDLILSETNIKSIEYINDTSGIIKKKIKPNFKALGAKAGKQMKDVAAFINALTAEQLDEFEKSEKVLFVKDDFSLDVLLDDVEIIAEDVPGWQVTNMGKLTVALDVTVTYELKQEGISRELVNRIQNLRKELNFEVTDKIKVRTSQHEYINEAVKNNLSYICAEILATSFELVTDLDQGEKVEIDEQELLISITKA